MLELSEVLWQYFDIGSIITIFGIVFTMAKKISTYFKQLNNRLDSIDDNISNIHNKLADTQLSLLHNDIKLMIDTESDKEDLLKTYDTYKELGGNSFIEKLVDDYLSKN